MATDRLRRRVVLPADPDLSEQVGDVVAELARVADLPRGPAYWLRLAVDEIATNIADHGYRGGTGVIDVVAGVDPDRVWVRLGDDAPAFDPRSYDPYARLATQPAEREAGGNGLLLALTKLDGFDYRYTAGRNENVLIINRPGPGAAGAGPGGS